MTPAPMVKIRVDRYALAGIASDKSVLKALVETSFSINRIRNTEPLLERLLDRIFSLIPATCGAVLFAGGKPDSLEPAAYRGSPVNVNAAIAGEVLRERVAIMSNDGDSILCAPLRVFDSNLGVIYLDSPEAAAFEMNHLHLLIAIASIAAISLEHTRYVERLEGENQRLHEEINIHHEIIGESPRMQEVRSFIGKVAPSDSAVLILGESGTGKERVSRPIHRNSRRSAGPFVVVNCAAIVDTLVESELFGNEKNAFTGAAAQRKGKIEAADHGTLFLDEVGELSMPMIPVDVRVVAATNRNLEERIKEGRFRQDLYFRLQVVVLRMPSLAERREDIPILAAHFLQKFRHVRVVSGFSTEARRVLASYDWPGNVRELQNAIERALVLGQSEVIQPEDLPEALTETKSPGAELASSYHALVNQLKRSLIDQALQQAEGNHAEAARMLDLSPSYMRRLAHNLNVKLP